MKKHLIWNLILRDMRAYQKHIIGISLIILIMGMLMIFINTNLSRMFASGTSIILLTIIFPFINELKNRSVWQHTASLPVTRKAMVTARYLLSLLIILVNIILWVCAYYAFMKLLGSNPKYALNISVIIMVSMNLLLNLALFYLVYFRFNFAIAIGIYLFLMIVPSFVQVVLNFNYGMFIEDFNQPLALSIVSTAFLIISFSSSIIHFNHKDL